MMTYSASFRRFLLVPLLGLSMAGASLRAETVIDAFEYPSTDELAAFWIGNGNAMVTWSDLVAPGSTGVSSMSIQFNFPKSEWTTEVVRGSYLENPVSIDPEQWLSFRIKGDPAFASSDFHNLYLYAYDVDGKFGRWGAPTPSTDDWQIFNFQAKTIEQPWDSSGLPDLSQIARFSWFQYGSQAAIDTYTAVVQIDDLAVLDAPLVDFAPPSKPRVLIDDFEGYASNDALLSFYGYQDSPAATVTTGVLSTPAPQGNNALLFSVDFAAGQYPWGSVRSAMVAPFSFPTNAVVTLRFKGDPGLAQVADDGTSFWISFYDKTGQGINYLSGADVVTSGEWTTITAAFQDFWSTSPVDLGNLVQWRLLVQGWTGSPESEPSSGSFQVDDIRITVPTVPPSLAISRGGDSLKVQLSQLTPGKTYELRVTPDLKQWSTATTLTATTSTAEWIVAPVVSHGFFQLVEKTQ